MKLSLFLKASALTILALTLIASNSSHAGAQTVTGPLAAFDYHVCVTCAIVGFPVFFNGNSSLSLGRQITSYTWTFGDGPLNFTSNSPGAFHDYNFPGNYLVSLKVTDSSGLADSIRQIVSTNSEPRFTISPPKPIVGEPVIFNASSSVSFNPFTNPILGLNWDFGDGTSATGKVVTHAYSASGPHRIILTLVTAQGNPSISHTLIVIPNSLIFTGIFEGVNVTISGFFFFNSTSQTLTAAVSINAVNTTSGTTLISKSFNISLTLRSTSNIRLLFIVPSQPLALALTCAVNTTTGQVSCFISRDPDIDHNGSVNINDLSMIALSYQSSIGSQRYNPAADLDGNGTVDITDLSIDAIDLYAPIFQ